MGNTSSSPPSSEAGDEFMNHPPPAPRPGMQSANAPEPAINLSLQAAPIPGRQAQPPPQVQGGVQQVGGGVPARVKLKLG